MENLNKCDEWCLIQALRGRLSGRLARYDLQHRPESEAWSIVISQGKRELFETELRQIFTREDITLNLSESQFHDFRDKLRDLCALLDRLVSPQITKDAQALGIGNFRSPSIVWNLWDRVREAYPNLMALYRFLANIPEDPVTVFDVVTGPHQIIFKLPDDISSMESGLKVVTECNNLFTQSSTSRHSQYASPKPKPKKAEWEDTRLRDRAATIFASLFQRFTCEQRHGVMLQLSKDSAFCAAPPILHLLLSCYPELKRWQEVLQQLNLSFSANLSADRIQDICAWLQGYTGQGKRPRLLVETFGVVGCVSGSTSPASIPIFAARESLDELLAKGAFEDFTYKNFRTKSPEKTFNPVDKRTLAVQLGRCLMDFFDFDLDTKDIHLSNDPSSWSKNSIPCLSFSSGTLHSSELHLFRRGDPVLLFFAKLLLEIDQGQKIPIDINPEVEQNEKAWMELFEFVDKVGSSKVSYYVDAVRECLLLHTRLPRSVRSGQNRGRKAHLAIRRTIYDHVVQNLETELDSLTQTSKKRDRPGSPPRVSTNYSGKAGFPEFQENFLSESPQRNSFDTFYYETPSQVTHHPPKRQRTPNIQTSAPRQPIYIDKGKFTSEDGSRDDNVSLFASDLAAGMREANGYRTPLWAASKAQKMDYSADTTMSFAARTPELQSLVRSAQGWMKKADSYLAQIAKSKRRIKVAVLDTGVDLENSILSQHAHRIWFLRGDARSNMDTDGHGTLVVQLLLLLTRNIEIYVHKIAESRGNLSLSAREIEELAKIIREASWRQPLGSNEETAGAGMLKPKAVIGIDIINMSFGFSDADEPILNPLREALNFVHTMYNVLILAAARNDGGNTASVMWPASEQSSVICVNSSDGNGTPSDFNPTQRGPRICTLGVGHEIVLTKGQIAHASRKGTKEPPPAVRIESGTSFATPVAAALVATILDVVGSYESKMEELSEMQKNRLRKLRTQRGMTRVLIERCVGTSQAMRDAYYYITPWFFKLDQGEVYMILDIFD
ncbi:hypothetical protein CEP52_001023 [Fusarium oligoseptatum]|uniref:Uncharacterized protein n=1 Tax=Fusarium oligoseptatum TaxID=2604345 RepID=A0A428UL53_9HYPO|nr:hypothetical protein CEP52_001023 [Fusarium oligoseptatum]